MTTTDDFASVAPTIERDRYGRPLIKLPNSDKRMAYTRATTLASTLEDQYNLTAWKQRMTMLGLIARQDLAMSVASTDHDDKRRLNDLAEQAMEASGANARREIGTALHKFCERLDLGQNVGPIPGDFARDVEAYRAETGAFRMLHVERFVVLDELRVAGTPDRVVEWDGQHFIFDLKTGSGVELAQGSISMQLAIYAHSTFYDDATGEREPLPSVNGQRAIVAHLPAGSGRCSLHWVNIAAGWEQVRTAFAVREWRKRKDLLAPFEINAAMDNLVDAGLIDDPIVSQLRAATSAEQLGAIWRDNRHAWTNEHTALAAEIKAALTNQGASA